MDRPLEIAFHNMPSSPTLEGEIRAQVAKLEGRHRHLIGCRVSLEPQHQQHQRGTVMDVHILLSVPGHDLAITHEPSRARHKSPGSDARAAIRDAFQAAERRLRDLKEVRSAPETAAAPNGSALSGRITQLRPDADHGFLLTPIGTQLLFHRDSVTNGRLDDLREGMTVHYVEAEGDAGPVAIKVRLAER